MKRYDNAPLDNNINALLERIARPILAVTTGLALTAAAFVPGCGDTEEPVKELTLVVQDDGPQTDLAELLGKDGERIEVTLDASGIEPLTANYSDAVAPAPTADVVTDELPELRTVEQDVALNYQTAFSLTSGATRTWSLTVAANKDYYLTVTPTSGDPDLSVLVYSGGRWVQLAGSTLDTMRVDRLKVRRSTAQTIRIVVRGYTAASGALSVAWESNNRLTLDAPFFNQNSLGGAVGDAACSASSGTMELATLGRVRVDEMATAARTIFNATANTSVGLRSRDLLANHLLDVWGLRSVTIDTSTWGPLYARIQSEIRAGRPMILGSRSMSSAGHYMLLVGFEGAADSSTARLIVNDPNGLWSRTNVWNETASGQRVSYPYRTITSNSADGVFVIIP